MGGAIDDDVFENPFSLALNQDWTFDETTEITVCSDLDEDKSIQCKVHNLKVGYSINSIPTAIDLIDKSFSFCLQYN